MIDEVEKIELIIGKSVDLGLNEGGIIFGFHNINLTFFKFKNFLYYKIQYFFVKFNRFLQKNEKTDDFQIISFFYLTDYRYFALSKCDKSINTSRRRRRRRWRSSYG